MTGKWLIPLLLLTAIAPFAIYFYNGGQLNGFGVGTPQQPVATIQFQQPNLQRRMEPGAQFGVVRMNVLDGYKFNVQLDNGQWIEAHLSGATKPEATPVVVEMLKTGAQPSVILYRKVENYWIVDMHLNVQGGRQSLVFLLQQQGLAY